MNTLIEHNEELQVYSGPASRFRCPQCGKSRELSRYVNRQTGEYIADHVGRCNREANCGYHYTPKQYRQDNGISLDNTWNAPRPTFAPVPSQGPKVLPVQYLPRELLEKTLQGYESNNLFQFFTSLFREDVARLLAESYYLGTSKRWPGANIFWQIDYKGDLRQAKIMLYSPITGRRSKEDNHKPYFAGKAILNDYSANLQQCFYGEVLLTMYRRKRVAIVESEKTAMIASIYFPQLIWLATGGSNGCKWTTSEVCKVLRGREVILFPDLGFYEKWKQKADQVWDHVKCKITVSDLLERHGSDTERAAGWDLADYLLQNRDTTGLAMTAANYPVFWDQINDM